MARKIKITVTTATNYVDVQDYDTVSNVIYNRIVGGMGEYHWQVVEGVDLTDTATVVAFVHNSGAKFGTVKIADIESVTINGVAATITNLSLVRDALSSYFFSVGGGYQFYKVLSFTSANLLNDLAFVGAVGGFEILPAVADCYYDWKATHEFTYGTTAYTQASKPTFYSQVVGGSATFLIDCPTSALNSVIDRVVTPIIPQFNSSNVLPVIGYGERIMYKLANNANQTGGDGTLIIKVWYNIIRKG